MKIKTQFTVTFRGLARGGCKINRAHFFSSGDDGEEKMEEGRGVFLKIVFFSKSQKNEHYFFRFKIQFFWRP